MAAEGRAGRPPIDPRIVLALRLYATVEGVGSARALARLCADHVGLPWICGGGSVHHHTLSDFRIEHGAALGGLLTQSVAVLVKAGLVTLERVARDGMRVRASAGAASFRRRGSLRACLGKAEAQGEASGKEVNEAPAAASRRQAAALQRAVCERAQPVRAAPAQYRWWRRSARRPSGKRRRASP